MEKVTSLNTPVFEKGEQHLPANNRTVPLMPIASRPERHCLQLSGPRQAKKFDFEHAQHAQIQIILCMGKVSSGPLFSIHTFCSIYRFCLLADSEGPDQIVRLRRLIWAFAVRIYSPEDTFSHDAAQVMQSFDQHTVSMDLTPNDPDRLRQ